MYLKKLFPSLFVNKDVHSFACETCQFAKQTRVPYPLQPYKIFKPFSLIHSDIWGPSRINNISGVRWFITFIDDHTRVSWVFLLKEKSNATNIFQNFHKMVETQFQTKIQFLRTDNGQEYFNNTLGPYLVENVIFHQSSCVDTPNKMVSLNVKTGTYSKWLMHSCLLTMFLSFFRGKQFLHPAI